MGNCSTKRIAQQCLRLSDEKKVKLLKRLVVNGTVDEALYKVVFEKQGVEKCVSALPDFVDTSSGDCPERSEQSVGSDEPLWIEAETDDNSDLLTELSASESTMELILRQPSRTLPMVDPAGKECQVVEVIHSISDTEDFSLESGATVLSEDTADSSEELVRSDDASESVPEESDPISLPTPPQESPGIEGECVAPEVTSGANSTQDSGCFCSPIQQSPNYCLAFEALTEPACCQVRMPLNSITEVTEPTDSSSPTVSCMSELNSRPMSRTQCLVDRNQGNLGAVI